MKVVGEGTRRPAGNENPDLPTGEVEVVGAKLRNMMPFLDPVQLPQPATV